MISVIIPCFNSEDVVSRAIESVLKQTYTDYEIILVNNNSSDNTLKILNDYLKENPGVIKVFNEYKKGAPAARNKGLDEAKGEWIQFLDADDELMPEKLEKHIAIANNSKADIIVGNCYLYKPGKKRTHIKARDIETKDVWKGLILSQLGITSANLWRRRAVLAAGGWNEIKSSSQEYDLLFRMLQNNANVDFLLSPLATVYWKENSISRDRSKRAEVLDNNIKLRLEIKEYLRAKGILTKQLNYIIDTYIYSYLYTATGLYPLIPKKGILPEYLKKTLKESNLELPLGYIFKFHFNRIVKKVKDKL